MSQPILIRGARVLTMGGGPGARRGAALGELGALDDASVLIRDGLIEAVGQGSIESNSGMQVIEADGRVLMPAFIDAHTHAMWAGERLREWERSLRGASYLEILESGGGIMSTVRAVRQASREELASNLRTRLEQMLREGTTTVEVKSGYGLTTNDELKMLHAIQDAADSWSGTVIPTALLGHALAPDEAEEQFVNRTIDETLPAVSEQFPDISIDAYCEKGAWSPEACERLFEKASTLGHSFRVHTDQFNELGMTRWAVARGASSVDHLEASSSQTLARVGSSETFAVLLPCSGFHLDDRFANGRHLADAGAKVVLATNCNPGSAPTSSIPMAIALVVRRCGLLPTEAIAACTANAAALLALEDRGFISPGAHADLVLLRHRDERALAHEFGGNPVEVVICNGNLISPCSDR